VEKEMTQEMKGIEESKNLKDEELELEIKL